MFYSTRSKLIGSFLGVSLLVGAVSLFIGVRLFGKFIHFKQETETSRNACLGLFITREIITKHGGKIWVESEEGRWINFLFALPKGEQKNGLPRIQ